MVGKINVAWRLAMATLGMNFTREEHASGWPETLKHGQLAALQYPYATGEPSKRRLALARVADILAACKAGELPHIEATYIPEPEPANLHIISSGVAASDGWKNRDRFTLAGMPARIGYRAPSEPPKPVTTYRVTAADFAAWLAAQPETPSEHIAAWFDSQGLTAAPLMKAPAEAPEPQAKTPGKLKRRDLLTPAIESAQKECSDPYDAPAVYTVLCRMAGEKIRPLIGVTPEGVKWTDGNDDLQFLSIKSLRDRLSRQKKNAAQPRKTPLKRVK